jgi:O-antigen/teichoic acid export membrane protein
VRGLSNIRFRYTGFINFAAQLISIITGFLFVVTVTRNLATADFGFWQNIGDLLNYATIFSGIVPFSVIRYVARGHRDAVKTGIAANTLLSLPIIGIFLILSPYFGSIIGANPLFFQVASLHILMFYILPAVQNAVYAKAPHILGYGTVIYEVTKVAVGIVLVTYFRTGLLGAIIAVVMAQVSIISFYLISVRKDLKERINWGYLRSWWKISFITLYGTLGDRLMSLGMILLILIWGASARAYVGAAVTIAVMISYSSTLATALYPKLLAKPDPGTVETALKLIMLFAIPMVGGTIILSDQLLTVLKTDYAAASIILCVYAISYLMDSFSTTLNVIITATEHADMNRETTLKQLAKSKLFLLPTLAYVSAAIYLPILVILLKLSATGPLQAALYAGLANIFATIPAFIIRYRTAKKSLPFSLPVRSLARYTLATILMVIILSQINLGATLSRLLILVFIGSVTYFGAVLAIDSETRALTRSAISFIREKLGHREVQSSIQG